MKSANIWNAFKYDLIILFNFPKHKPKFGGSEDFIMLLKFVWHLFTKAKYLHLPLC